MNKDYCKRAGIVYLAVEILFLSISFSDRDFGFSMNLLVSQLAVLVPGVVFVLMDKRSLHEKIGLGRISPSDILMCFIYFLLMRKVLGAVNFLSMFFTENSTTDYMLRMVAETPAWVCILLVGVMPAVGEELLFRGVLYSSFKKVSPLGAMLVSSFLFGVLHGNLNQFLYAMVAGVMFILIMEATGSLLAPSIIHCLIDLLSIVSIIALIRQYGEQSIVMYTEAVAQQSSTEAMMESLPGELLWGTLCLLGALCLAAFVARKNGRWENLCRVVKFRAEHGNGNKETAAISKEDSGVDLSRVQETDEENHCGNLSRVQETKEENFGGDGGRVQETKEENFGGDANMVPECRIFSGPLIAGTIIGIIYMVLVEIAKNMVA